MSSHDGHDKDAAPPAGDARRVTPEAPGPAGEATAGEATDAASAAAPGAGRAHRPRSQVLIAVLCAILGFALVAQVRLNQGDSLSSLRQDELVRLLDEITQRRDELVAERDELVASREELFTSEDSRRVAEEAARQRAVVQGVLAGTLPVQGPGVTLRITDPSSGVPALTLFHVLEELRNAGAEAVEVSGVRLTASSWFADATGPGAVVNGTLLTPPYEWVAIGDAQTLAVALDIPGGALASIRNAGGEGFVTQSESLQVTAVAEPPDLVFATPVPSPTATP
jgi:uncharacterized protein YlxW (UPF0749 family)